MGILFVLILFLAYMGTTYQKKREVAFKRHTLRAKYKSYLSTDKTKLREILNEWEEVVKLSDSFTKEDLHQCLNQLQKILKEVLILTRFEEKQQQKN